MPIPKTARTSMSELNGFTVNQAMRAKEARQGPELAQNPDLLRPPTYVAAASRRAG
ncbi:MAG TPA: hypothetical protein VJK29_22375 [Terriglobales bacterium]|nr:hypothetical protein [Terriglobales bacterium]